MNATLCKHCDHFVDENYFGPATIVESETTATTVLVRFNTPGASARDETFARYIHLEDEDHDFDHDAEPGETRDDWETYRPDLFIMHKDGRIGPNSDFHANQRGKTIKPRSDGRNHYPIDFSDIEVGEINALPDRDYDLGNDDVPSLPRAEWMAIAFMCLGKAQRLDAGDYDMGDPIGDREARVQAEELRQIAAAILDEFKPGDGKI